MSKAVIEGALKILLCTERSLSADQLLGAVALNQYGHRVSLDAMDVGRMCYSLCERARKRECIDV